MRFSGETKGIEVAIYNTLRDLVQKSRCAGTVVVDREMGVCILTFSVHHTHSIGFAVGVLFSLKARPWSLSLKSYPLAENGIERDLGRRATYLTKEKNRPKDRILDGPGSTRADQPQPGRHTAHGEPHNGLSVNARSAHRTFR
jgi:hypothetical protein